MPSFKATRFIDSFEFYFDRKLSQEIIKVNAQETFDEKRNVNFDTRFESRRDNKRLDK